MLSRFEQFSFVISEIYQYIQKLQRDEMIKYGFKGSYAQYLTAINRYSEGITSAELSEICDKDKAAISRVVTEMEEKGLITRERRTDKLYRARIMLTDAGKKATAFVSERAEIAAEEVGKQLSDEERRKFYATLAEIASNLEVLSKDGIPQKKG